MKATGIVRRIDDLGRVVIPKEIRRTQAHPRGRPLEIFVSGAGRGDLQEIQPHRGTFGLCRQAMRRCSTKRRARPSPLRTGRVVAAAGAARDAVERSLAPVYTRAVEQRRLFTAADAASALPLCEGVDTSATALMPILCNGDLIGSVALTAACPTKPWCCW